MTRGEFGGLVTNDKAEVLKENGQALRYSIMQSAATMPLVYAMPREAPSFS